MQFSDITPGGQGSLALHGAKDSYTASPQGGNDLSLPGSPVTGGGGKGPGLVGCVGANGFFPPAVSGPSQGGDGEHMSVPQQSASIAPQSPPPGEQFTPGEQGGIIIGPGSLSGVPGPGV